MRSSGYAVSQMKKQAIRVIEEYERIVKFLEDTNSFFLPGVLEVNTNNHINEYSCSFRLDLSCDLLPKENKKRYI
jgi:carbon monoxide dehydrogenase subunit G